MATIKRQRADGSWEYIQMTGEDVNTLKNDIVAHLAERSSLEKAGHIQLNSATNSTDETTAATPKAVKAAMDKANEAFTSVDNGKQLLRTTIIDKGGSILGSHPNSFAELAKGIDSISNRLLYPPGDMGSLYISAIDEDDNRYSYSGAIYDKYGNKIRQIAFQDPYHGAPSQYGYTDGWEYPNNSAHYRLKDINGNLIKLVRLGEYMDREMRYRKVGDNGHLIFQYNNQQMTWVYNLNGVMLKSYNMLSVSVLNKNNKYLIRAGGTGTASGTVMVMDELLEVKSYNFGDAFHIFTLDFSNA
ncbi:tail fiber protein [Cytobacillus solani]|uniref:tail fiber protein n=1 Tax=Cytobacillus solani TaxID=1637975 RepID=UPI0009499AFB|nr:tail fiber protein [Cytobacillus solani]